MSKIIISCFYTKDTPYEQEFYRFLKPSLDKLGLTYTVDVMQSAGSWYKNVAMKPHTLLRALERYPDYNVVGIDVDAEITQNPTLLYEIPEEYDIACHFLNWKEWYGHDVDIEELLSGTIFLRNNKKVKEMCQQWYNMAMGVQEWEQKCLERLIKQNSDIKVYKLPIDYTYIATLPDGSSPRVKVPNPIVIHHQASRRLKKRIL